jgi:hypothetical protein
MVVIWRMVRDIGEEGSHGFLVLYGGDAVKAEGDGIEAHGCACETG